MEGRPQFAFFTVPIFGRQRHCVEQRRQRAELRFTQLRVRLRLTCSEVLTPLYGVYLNYRKRCAIKCLENP
jgi:hypothetical protein